MKLIKHIIIAVVALISLNALAQQSKKRIDGVIGVVGDHVVLDSDIDKGFVEAQMTGYDVSKISRCELFGSLLESKLFAHQAVQDSIVIEPETLDAEFESQMNRIVEGTGSVENAIKIYRKKNYDELKDDLKELINNNLLASRMQEKIVSKIQITPEEVRLFFNTLPKDELPLIGDEVELSEIVIKPEISKEQKQAVIDQLNEIRTDILEHGASFASKVYMYSEDQGSIKTGGLYPIDKKTQFVKEFKDMAFSLKEGEISQPFETEYGFHIILLEKIRGNTLDVRHILISPKPTDEAIAKAKEKLDNIRLDILNNTITFEDAARKYSDEKDNKNSGGVMINPQTGETRYEVNRISDRFLYNAISGLNIGDMSQVTLVIDPRGSKSYQLIKVTNKIAEHKADYNKDYVRIKDFALRDKQSQEVGKWISKKIDETYIYIVDDYKNCEFKSNWVKK